MRLIGYLSAITSGNPMPVVLEILKSVIALFIIIDPLGLIPIYMALTIRITPDERRRLLSSATLVAFVFLVVFAVVGKWILGIFGVTVSDFRIAGGILLLVIALHVINVAHEEENVSTQPGIVPIAVPLLAGPGAITTTIVLIGSYGLWITLISLAITFVLCYVIFRYVTRLYRLLGETGADVVAKIMGMLLAAIAVQFIRQGIQDIFHI